MMRIQNWQLVTKGTEQFPQLIDFSRLAQDERNDFADRLDRRGLEALKRRKKPGEKLDPDLLAFEEAHRAFATWKKQVGDAMGKPTGFRRYSSAGTVKKLREWAAMLLRVGINPGDYLEAAHDLLTSSPAFRPEVSFSPNYLFCDGVFDSVTDRIAARKRPGIVSKQQAGGSKKNSFVGAVDSRVKDFLLGVPGFELESWEGDRLNSIVIAAKRLAGKGKPFIPSNVRRFAEPLSRQPWIGEV